MLSVLTTRRSARLLVGVAVVAAVIGGSATASHAAPASVPIAGEPEPGLVTLDSGSPEEDAAEDGGSDVQLEENTGGQVDAENGSATGANAEVPLSPSDVDLVVKVRLAGLWEIPAGRMAEEKGNSERVREIGKLIADQHVRLDALGVNAANEVGVQLPNEPTAEQQLWIKEMREAEGEEFDQIFVTRLREAHGGIFPAIAMVRTGTRNETVRQLAIQANGFVGNHLSYLESTDLVDFKSLPEAPLPNKNPLVTSSGPMDAVAARAQQGGVSLTVIWALLMTCLVAGAIGVARFLRPRWGAGRDIRAAAPLPVRAERPAPRPAPDSQGGPRPVADQTPAYPRPLARPRS
jgi:predicted outer membrane protein